MNDKSKVISVDYEDVSTSSEMYYTAPQVAKELGETDTRIRHWADSFDDILNIDRVNGRKKYKRADIEKLKFIKHLVDEKKWSHEQVKVYCSKQGFSFANYDAGLINPSDPLGFQALASALALENNKNLIEFQKEQIKLLSEFKNNLLNDIQELINNNNSKIGDALEEICVSIDRIEQSTSDMLETNYKALQEDLKLQGKNILEDNLKAITGQFEGIIEQHNKNIVDRDVEISNKLQEVLALRKKEIMQEDLNKEPKGFFSRLFSK